MFRVKRVYDSTERSDGTRFLVERLWPRGLKKESLQMDGWLKDVAPSADLRRWLSHDLAKWKEFQRRYRKELDAHPEAWQPILKAGRKGNVVLFNKTLPFSEWLGSGS